MSELSIAQLEQWLRTAVAERCGLEPDEVEVDRPFADYGFSSRDSVELTGRLEDLLDRVVPSTLIWQHPTIEGVAAAMLGQAQTGGPPRATAQQRVEAVLESKPRHLPPGHDLDPIAVVGIGCRLPGDVTGPESLWRLLDQGGDAVGSLPPRRWRPPRTETDARVLERTSRKGGFLGDIAGFDATFFAISPNEAQRMDPQQRMLLEVSWEALEHAAIAPETLRGSHTGVFVGVCASEYGQRSLSDLDAIDAWSGTGGALSVAANRLSYTLNLRGPSVAVDTACSSSLSAVHLAIQSLQRGESDLVLAGGANLLLEPAVTVAFHELGVISPSGRCRPFSADADGIVRAEGVGVVVLKRLSDAQAAGDRILAVLKGSAVNQDGRSNGITAPNADAQEELLRRAYESAGIDPRQVDYVEAHGTGTLLGDPIEARSLGTVLGAGRDRARPLLIGSVKSNFGHLEAAAGVVGLIKVVLALEHGRIPATLHFAENHPHVDFEALGVAVVDQPVRWPSADRPARAGVSSFGFGGTNAHVIVEQAPAVAGNLHQPTPGGPDPEADAHLARLVLAGPDESRVRERAGDLAAWLEGPGRDAPLRDVEFTLARRSSGRVRAAVIGRQRVDVIGGLNAYASAGRAPNLVEGRAGDLTAQPVWVFSGQGSQWAGMGLRLLREEPAFAAALEELDAAIAPQSGFSVREVLAAKGELTAMERLQPVLFAMQVGLARLLIAYGERPSAIIGHSLGEIAAAVLSGALSLADGARVVVERSRLLATLTGTGAMALTDLAPDELPGLQSAFSSLEIASYNAPSQLTVAGTAEQIEEMVASLEDQGRFAKRIKSVVAGHCRLVEPIVAPLRLALDELVARPQQTPVYGTVLEDPRVPPPFDASYWAANIRQPVRFQQAVAAAVSDGHSAFIEISPHAVLGHALLDNAQAAGATRPLVFSTSRRGEDERTHFHAQLAALALNRDERPSSGPRRTGPPEARLIDLPRIRWRHVRHWLEPARPHAPRGGHPVLGESVELPGSVDHYWQRELAPLSGAGGAERWAPLDEWLDIAGAAAEELRGHRPGELVIRDLVLNEPRALGERCTLSTRVHPTGNSAAELTVHSRSGRGRWRLHASAVLSLESVKDDPPQASGEGQTGEASGDWLELTPVRTGDREVERALLRAYGTTVPTGKLALAAITEVRHDPERLRLRGLKWRELSGDELPVALPEKLIGLDWRTSSRPPSLDLRGSWLVITEPDDRRGEELAATLRERGARATAVCRQEAEQALFARPELDEVVLLAPPACDTENAEDCAYRGQQLVLWATHVVQSIGACAHFDTRSPRLQLITRGAAAVRASDRPDPGAGALRGLIRVLAYEHPELRARSIDFDPSSGTDAVVAELAACDREDEVAWRAGRRYVARLAAPNPHTLVADSPRTVRRDGAYLLSGGLGGLGLVLVRWLAARGAARVVLLGRSAPGPAAERELAAARALGTEVVVVRGDVADQKAVNRAVAALAAAGARPSGVIHAAAAFEDRSVAQLDAESLGRVWSAKALGAARLSGATEHLPLDWWVGFSSAAALIGSPGQAAYAAANAFLDSVCARRRANGLAATTINWGTWSQVGRAAQRTVDAVRPLDPDEGVAALEALLSSAIGAIGVLKLDAQTLVDSFPGIAEIQLFSEIVTRTGSAQAGRDWEGIEGLDPATARERVAARLGTVIADVLGLEPAALNRRLPLPALGVDSLLAMRIRNAVQHDFERSLPPALMLRGASIDDLVAWLCDALELTAATQPDAVVARVAPRDASERLVASIWQQLLGKSEISVTEHLWRAEADRELLASVAAQLGQRASRPLDVEQLLDAPTIEKQASLVRESAPTSTSPLRLLAPGDGSYTLFLFHPGGGDTLVYRQLVERLPPELTVWGLDRLPQHLSVEKRAASYLDLLRQISPSGPYQLAGWSFGGALAYETAYQLQQRGESIETLAMIDTLLPLPDPAGSSDREILERRFQRFEHFLQSSYGRKVTLPYTRMARLDDEEQAALLIETIISQGLIDPGAGAAIIEHQRTSYLDVRALERYRPQRIAGPVVLFSAREQQPDRMRDPRFDRDDVAHGWDAVCDEQLEIVRVPGHHLSLLDPPHVDVLARHLRQLLACPASSAA